MTRNALVLGGGGALGISWEVGLLAGLREAGIDVGNADLIIGTSAGSVVGTQIALGKTWSELMAEQLERDDGRIGVLMSGIDPASVLQLFMRWAGIREMTQETCVEIGAAALAAQTVPEDEWVSYFEDHLEGAAWPERPLLLTAVDCETGALQPWDRDSGVDLARAVASSCAVPGLFPAVTIKDRRYTDGGVRSGTSADLASGYDAVLIVAPIGARSDGIDPLLGRQARAEAKALSAAGTSAELVFPDAAALEAMGINRMDVSRRDKAVHSGVVQGKALASRLAATWAKAAA
jgi:NTE family protein